MVVYEYFCNLILRVTVWYCLFLNKLREFNVKWFCVLLNYYLLTSVTRPRSHKFLCERLKLHFFIREVWKVEFRTDEPLRPWFVMSDDWWFWWKFANAWLVVSHWRNTQPHEESQPNYCTVHSTIEGCFLYTELIKSHWINLNISQSFITHLLYYSH